MKKEKILENSFRLLVFVIGIFSICIVLLTVKLKVNAASEVFTFPYFVPLYKSVNTAIPDSVISDVDSLLRSSLNLSSDDNIMFFVTDLSSTLGEYQWNEIFYIINPSVNFNYPDSYDYLSNSIDVYNTGFGSVEFKWDGRVRGPYVASGVINLLGNVNTIDITQGSYTPRYPFYMSGSDVLTPNGDIIIFTNSVPSAPDTFQTGHAVEPNFDSDSIIDSGLNPNHVPNRPTITIYNFTTYNPPSVDTSSLENLVKSVYDVIVYNGSYVVSNIVGAIGNLISNFNNIVGYLGELVSYLFGRVINTIKQSLNNLFENFRYLFEPVLNSFANMINIFNTLYNLGLKDGVFDIPTLFGALFVPNQSDLALLVDTFVEFDYLQTASVSIKSLLLNIFSVLNDDAVYSIHVQGFNFHGVSVPDLEISFDWYLPYKATGDIFISAFLIVGYLYWLWTRLSGIFHGAVPDSQGASSITLTDHSSEFSGFPF